jgi:hypothetical protein
MTRRFQMEISRKPHHIRSVLARLIVGIIVLFFGCGGGGGGSGGIDGGQNEQSGDSAETDNPPSTSGGELQFQIDEESELLFFGSDADGITYWFYCPWGRG